MCKISPYVMDNSHIHLHFHFHENPANSFETMVLNKNELTINTINLRGLGRKKNNKKYFFFHRYQISYFKCLGSVATEILSHKRDTAACYTNQSNNSRRIFNSGREIKFTWNSNCLRAPHLHGGMSESAGKPSLDTHNVVPPR